MKHDLPYCVVLHPKDNVAVVVREHFGKGRHEIGGISLSVQQDVPFGHKVALRPIAALSAVIKCGVPIGSATTPIAPGEHVHLHNMKSDYIATYTLDDSHGG